MSGLLGDLLSSSHSLTNQTASMSLIGNNIANVNNDSYSRQTQDTTSSSGPGGVTYTDTSVVSARDSIMDRQVVEETSTSGALTEQVSLYTDLNTVTAESLNGSLGTSLETAEAEGTGITGALTTFYNAWSSYATTPNSSASKTEVLSAAQELASRLNSADSSLDDVQEQQNIALESDVGSANDILSTIADLNSSIVRMTAAGGNTSELVDERQSALEDLASLIDFNYTNEDNGSVTISVTSDAAGGSTTLVSGGNAGSIGISTDATTGAYDGLTATAYNGTAPDGISPEGGSLSVLNPTVTSAAIQSVRDQLDALAGQITTAVNTVYADSNATGDAEFFTGTTAGDIALAVTDASDLVAYYDSDAEGSNQLALDMADLINTDYSVDDGDSIDGSMTEYAASIASDVAEKLSSASNASEAQSDVLDQVTTSRSNAAGTTTSEELTNLILTQHAYQASARVLSTINTLLEIVTTRLGS